jgi:hypothetical protein
MKGKILFRNALLLFIASIFFVDIYRRVTDFAVFSQSYHQHALNAVFRSTFGIFELAMIGIMIYFIKKFPARRLRRFFFFPQRSIRFAPCKNRFSSCFRRYCILSSAYRLWARVRIVRTSARLGSK